MEIFISSAVGHGLTELSAFDSALSRLGVRDQNLIHLSSVIPLGATVKLGIVDFNNKFQGDKVYCVYAQKRTRTRGESVAAGVGWVTTEENPKWGIFVEHTGHTKEEVAKQIRDSITSMTQYRNDYSWSELQHEIVVGTCKTKPICAMALAVYSREEW